MCSKKKLIGSTLVVLAAIAFTAMPVVSSAHCNKYVKCYGIGKYHNGKMMTKKACLKMGGSYKSKRMHEEDNDHDM